MLANIVSSSRPSAFLNSRPVASLPLAITWKACRHRLHLRLRLPLPGHLRRPVVHVCVPPRPRKDCWRLRHPSFAKFIRTPSLSTRWSRTPATPQPRSFECTPSPHLPSRSLPHSTIQPQSRSTTVCENAFFVDGVLTRPHQLLSRHVQQTVHQGDQSTSIRGRHHVRRHQLLIALHTTFTSVHLHQALNDFHTVRGCEVRLILLKATQCCRRVLLARHRRRTVWSASKYGSPAGRRHVQSIGLSCRTASGICDAAAVCWNTAGPPKLPLWPLFYVRRQCPMMIEYSSRLTLSVCLRRAYVLRLASSRAATLRGYHMGKRSNFIWILSRQTLFESFS